MDYADHVGGRADEGCSLLLGEATAKAMIPTWWIRPWRWVVDGARQVKEALEEGGAPAGNRSTKELANKPLVEEGDDEQVIVRGKMMSAADAEAEGAPAVGGDLRAEIDAKVGLFPFPRAEPRQVVGL